MICSSPFGTAGLTRAALAMDGWEPSRARGGAAVPFAISIICMGWGMLNGKWGSSGILAFGQAWNCESDAGAGSGYVVGEP